MKWRALSLSLLLLASSGMSQAADGTPPKREDVIELLEATGQARLASQMAGTVAKSMFESCGACAQAPERIRKVVLQEILTFLDEQIKQSHGMREQLIPIYTRYYNAAEIRQLITFYKSDLGKKTVSVMPLIAKDSMAAGQLWATALVPELKQRVEGALKREGLSPVKQTAQVDEPSVATTP